MDQIILEPEPKTSGCWIRYHKISMPEAGAVAWNLSSGSIALISRMAISCPAVAPKARNKQITRSEQPAANAVAQT